MRKNFLFIIIMLVVGHALAQTPSQKALDKFKKIKWLEGTWSRTNVKTGQSGHERWSKTAPFELRGYGVTMKGTDTLFTEKLRIVARENDLMYVADVPENEKPAYFKLTKITDMGFVCENPEHDFPKKIAYQREGNKLKATISGNGKAMDFLFIRKD